MGGISAAADSPLLQQPLHERQPFRIQCRAMKLAARAGVPVIGVPLDALFSVQIGVHSHGVARREVVDHSVGARPIAFGVPPERGQRRREPGRRLRKRQRGFKLVDLRAWCHSSLVSPLPMHGKLANGQLAV